MSTARRVTSGSLAGWMRMGMLIGGQILTVPLFLSKWSASEYGAFLLAQSVVSILNTLDVGHQNYIGYRFIAESSPKAVSLGSFSAIPFAALFGSIQFAIAIAITRFDILNISGKTISGGSLETATSCAILLLTATWVVSGGIGGIFGRSVAPYGHLPRLAWWNVLNAALQLATPVIACMLGADILLATASLCVATIFYNTLLYIDIANIWRAEGLRPVAPDIKLGARNAWHGMALVFREFFLQFRQQGVRALLAPMVGTEALASFTITRTGANVALQGLSTFTAPLEPEVLRYVHERKTTHLNASLMLLTLFIVTLIITPTLPLQLVAPLAFKTWTHGKVAFDAVIFALLSSSVVFFAISQPALIIVRGNNLLKEQVSITITSSIVLILGLISLTPKLGLRGASLSLLLAEAYAALHTILIARSWLRKNGLLYPAREFVIGLISALATLCTTLGISVSAGHQYLIFSLGMALQLTLAFAIARRLPEQARAHLVRAIPGPLRRHDK